MKLFWLFSLILALVFASQPVLAERINLDKYPTEANYIVTPRGEGFQCSDLNKSCSSCSPNPHLDILKVTYTAKAQECARNNVANGCNQLVSTHPELKNNMRSCDLESVCKENVANNYAAALKGCFWNVPFKFGADTVDLMKDFPALAQALTDFAVNAPGDMVRKCLQDLIPVHGEITGRLLCMNLFHYVAGAMYSAPGLAETLYKKGEEWLKQQGVQLACYNPEARLEMICYGISSVISPKNIFELKKIPDIIKKSGLAQKARKWALEAEKFLLPTINKADKRLINLKKNYAVRRFTDQKENEDWYALATKAEPPTGTLFADMENSMIKFLNDETGDKELVTALTNMHKENVKLEMDALKKKFAGKVEFNAYSDFKSMRYAMSPVSGTEVPEEFKDELSKAFTRANDKFSREISGLFPEFKDSNQWFRAGMGTTADEASVAARYSRGAAGENKIFDFENDPYLTTNLVDLQKETELFRSNLEKSFAGKGLMEPLNPNLKGAALLDQKMIPNRKVLNALRKTKSDRDLVDAIKSELLQDITLADARNLRSYGELIDEFSPAIHVVNREFASLSESQLGGFSIDFAGMGAYNAQETAIAMARSAPGELRNAVSLTRTGEKNATEVFKRKKDFVNKTITDVLKENGIESKIVSSGDDMVVQPMNGVITPKAREEILKRLSASNEIEPNSIRMSQVHETIKDGSERMILATMGEACEKAVRARAVADKDMLKNTLLLVDVTGTSISDFSATLVLGTSTLSKTYSSKSIAELNARLSKILADVVKLGCK